MKKSRYTDPHIAQLLRTVETGIPVGAVCRQLGVSEATFLVCAKEVPDLDMNEFRWVRWLQEEEWLLKALVAALASASRCMSRTERWSRAATPSRVSHAHWRGHHTFTSTTAAIIPMMTVKRAINRSQLVC